MIIAAKLMLVYKKGPTTMNYKNSCPVPKTLQKQTKISNEFP